MGPARILRRRPTGSVHIPSVGKNNRQRRAAKARRRTEARRSNGSSGARGGASNARERAGSVPPRDPSLSPAEMFLAAVSAQMHGDGDRAAQAVARLAGSSQARVAEEIADCMEDRVASLWENGWQPCDLDRVVAGRLGCHEARLVRWIIASQSLSYEALGTRAQPRWMSQLEQIGARRDRRMDHAYLRELRDEWVDVLAGAVGLMGLLVALPPLPCLIDPPSRWGSDAPARESDLPPTMLGKVRALLAKAESTTFEAEADAFTAKAQELMARYRIDRVLLEDGGRSPRVRPIGRRVGIDHPYAEAKVVLLGEIAVANGCQAVWSRELGFTTVFGFAGELDAVEELFTSLLVQATVALGREGSKVDRLGRSRTTRFRRSFLLAFGYRIGRRLRDTVAATVTAAEDGGSVALVPVLARDDAAVRQVASETFPETGRISPSASDGAGWYAGTRFGDLADLGVGAIEPVRAA
jgi:hypothetical protein